ncbi:hypothetical protein [Oceanidesulfovibrio marinus]|uniref:Uncharacterized protein n=1 Tax=Oceanidesulfovibrio marinus TaxID=370038 RepID=A0A6P1ZJ92_9BACT|nr:hypothetical protein [Oceanidesulfovibrio marinus]TVM35771.1 hypothetical protein DQK91_03660 [Oceanidesulfovibrio marinus]
MAWIKRIILCLVAGALGGLANSIAVWLFGAVGISQALGFMMAPALNIGWLLPRLFYGALWGLLFLLPFWERRWVLKGLLISLAPTAYMLLVVFPKLGKGMWGFGAGATAPLFVLFFNAIWGVVAAYFLLRTDGKA